MYEQTITSTHIRVVEKIAKLEFIKKFYLVGGTSLSLQIGHRKSDDLDFFTDEIFEFKEVVKSLRSIFKQEELDIDFGRSKVRIEGIKVDFVYWALPIKYKFIKWRGINIMDARDIAMHKLYAMAGRSVKKDLADIFFINKLVHPIEKVFEDFKEINHKGDYSVLGTMRLLFDEETIKTSPDPIMLKDYNFDESLAFVKQKLRQIVINDLQLSKYLQ